MPVDGGARARGRRIATARAPPRDRRVPPLPGRGRDHRVRGPADRSRRASVAAGRRAASRGRARRLRARVRRRRRRRQADPAGGRPSGARRRRGADVARSAPCARPSAAPTTAHGRQPRQRLRRRDRARVPPDVHRHGRRGQPRCAPDGRRPGRRPLCDRAGAREVCDELRRHGTRALRREGQGAARERVGRRPGTPARRHRRRGARRRDHRPRLGARDARRRARRRALRTRHADRSRRRDRDRQVTPARGGACPRRRACRRAGGLRGVHVRYPIRPLARPDAPADRHGLGG